MWYLYMLIGLYLLIPVLKIFLEKATEQDELYLIIILFGFLSIVPFLSSLTGISFGVYIPINGIYLLYFLLGHYLTYSENAEIEKLGKLGFILAIFFLGIINIVKRDYAIEAYSPSIVLLTSSIFIMFKTYNITSNLLSRTKHLTFGVYLTHMVLINFAYKFLNLSPYNYPMIISVPIFFLIFFVGGLMMSWVLNKIPIMKKYVM